MKNKILRFIYRRFAAKFEDLMVEDYVQHLPADVRQDMETLFESQKIKLLRANGYLAFHLHQRMRNDPKNSERYQGMFVQLKLLDAILKSRPDVKPVTPAQEVQKAQPFDYAKNVDAALKAHRETSAQE